MPSPTVSVAIARQDARDISELFFDQSRAALALLRGKRKTWRGGAEIEERARRYRNYANEILEALGEGF